VSYDYTAELEDGLDDVSGGRVGWQDLLDAFWRDFKPKAGEVMEQKPSEVTAALDEFLAPWLFPTRRTEPTRGSAPIAATAGWRFAAASSARSSPAPIIPNANITQKFGQAAAARADGPDRVRRTASR
jgi:DNA topoisomerase-1